MRIKLILTSLLILTGICFASGYFGGTALAQTAASYNPLEKICNDAANAKTDADKSVACTNQDSTKFTGKDNIITRITGYVALAAGIVAVIVIIVYGIQIILSSGDASKVATARTAIIAAVVGLIVVFLAQAIVVFLVRKL